MESPKTPIDFRQLTFFPISSADTPVVSLVNQSRNQKFSLVVAYFINMKDSGFKSQPLVLCLIPRIHVIEKDN